LPSLTPWRASPLPSAQGSSRVRRTMRIVRLDRVRPSGATANRSGPSRVRTTQPAARPVGSLRLRVDRVHARRTMRILALIRAEPVERCASSAARATGFVRAALQCFIQSREPDVRGAPSKFRRGLPAILAEVQVACPLSPRGGPRRFRLRMVRAWSRRWFEPGPVERCSSSAARPRSSVWCHRDSVRTELSPDDSPGRAAGWLAAPPARSSSRARRTMRIVSGSGHALARGSGRSGGVPMRHQVTRIRRPRGPVEGSRPAWARAAQLAPGRVTRARGSSPIPAHDRRRPQARDGVPGAATEPVA
jgi:hypothetical protein